MHTRREALVTIGALLAAPSLTAACPKRNAVNDKLLGIAAQLRSYKEVSEILTYPDANATKALVHWEWVHYAESADQTNFEYIERSQRELMAALRRAMTDCRVGLSSLLTEGLIAGKEKTYIAGCTEVMRSCVWQQLVKDDATLLPSSEAVTKALHDVVLLQTQVPRLADIRDPEGNVTKTNSIHHSAAGYCGAPFMLHHLYGLKMIATEDATMFDKAMRAEWNRKDEERWVHDERDALFVKTALAQHNAVSHFVCGYGHDLTDDAAKNHVSLAVVKTHASAAHRKKYE